MQEGASGQRFTADGAGLGKYAIPQSVRQRSFQVSKKFTIKFFLLKTYLFLENTRQ